MTRVRWLPVALVTTWFVACGLNPQPEPPSANGGEHRGNDASAGSTQDLGDSGIVIPGAGGATGGPPPAGDGSVVVVRDAAEQISDAAQTDAVAAPGDGQADARAPDGGDAQPDHDIVVEHDATRD